MTLRARRALWRRREVFRYRKWRGYVQSKPIGDPLRVKWHRLYTKAFERRRALDKRIRRQPITQSSPAGIAFIRREEGCVLHPYNDSRGLATIGVGHLLHMSAVTTEDQRRWANFTQKDANTLLAHDLDRYERVVADAFRGAKLQATANRFDACVSLAFNIGTAGFASSTVARSIKLGDAAGAVRGFRMWVQPPELKGRREREVALFEGRH